MKATGFVVAVGSWEPGDLEGGRLYIDTGQVSVDVTDLDVKDFMTNLDVYSIDFASGQALKDGKPVGAIGSITPPDPVT